MNRYAVFFDLDGTLMQDAHHLYPRVEKMLKKLKENGHLCFVATGRGFTCIPEPLKKTMDGFVTLTGAGCIFNGKTIIEHKMPNRYIDQLAELSFSIGAPMFIQTDEKAEMIISPDFRYEDDVYGMDPYVTRYYRSYEEYANAEIEVGKVDTRIQFQNDVKNIPAVLSGELTTLDSGDGWLEITLPDINKGTAIKELCEWMDFNIENTICFGDSENDLAMFDVCGISIAVSGATQVAKEKAKIVLEDKNQDAIYRILQDFGLFIE